MASVTFAIPDDVKADMKALSWVNWSEFGKKEATKSVDKQKALKRALEIVSKSKFTEADADEMAEKVKASMHKRLIDNGLV